jgi:hypothetical protein
MQADPFGMKKFKKAGTPMDRSRFTPRLFFLSAAVLSLLGAAIRTAAYLTAFDTQVGYLDPGIWTSLSRCLYFIAPVILIAIATAIPKDTLSTAPCQTYRMAAAIPMALTLIAFTVVAFLASPPVRSNIFMFTVLLGVPAALYYGISSVKSTHSSDFVTILGFLPIIWCITAVADLYFDVYVTMNSSIKTSLHMEFLGFMAATLGELRFRIGRPLPRLAAILFGMSSFTCLTASIPLLVATGARVLNHPLHLMYAAVLLVAGLYSLYLLFSHACLSQPADDTEAQASVSESTDQGGTD